MDKQTADKLITAYLPKLYGFAIKKAFSYAEAEELCADIVAEVYASLRKADDVVNIEGYIRRISEHTYARFVSRKKRHEGVSIGNFPAAGFLFIFCYKFCNILQRTVKRYTQFV